MVIGSMILPLVLLLVPVLLTTYRYPLATASDPDDCELCTDGPEDRIKLRYPAISSGQILVCDGGYWQTVCDDQKKYKFSVTDANVSCYQLGFTSGQPGSGRGIEDGCLPPRVHDFIAVDPNAPCKVWDEKLSQCLKRVPDGTGSCTLKTTASVICNETAQVQLIYKNTPSYIGKVKHYYNSSWHTVCDGNWTDLISNSNVLCRQLGLGHAVENWLHYPDETDTSFLHTHMNCNGTENVERLTLCNHNFIMDKNCSGKSVPGIRCSGPEADDFESSATFTSIYLQWSVPNVLQYYRVIDSYNITYWEQGAKDRSKVTIQRNQSEVTIGGLSVGTQYIVTVNVVLRGDHPGPKTTLVISTIGYLVIGLASGLGVSLFGMLLACVLAVNIGVFAYLKTRAHQRMRGPYQDIDDAHDSDEEHEEEHVHQGNEQLHLQNHPVGENENQRLLPRRNEEEQPEQPAAANEQVPAEQPGAAAVRYGHCLLF